MGLGDTGLLASRREGCCLTASALPLSRELHYGAYRPVRQLPDGCCLNSVQLKGEAEDRPTFPLYQNLIMHVLHLPSHAL